MNVKNNEPKQTVDFCNYTNGLCDQEEVRRKERSVFFVYPSNPPLHAETIRSAIKALSTSHPDTLWMSWEDMKITGQILFCEICKQIRQAEYVVANITSLNFNVLFEIGYAIGLGKPVCPIRDCSYTEDKQIFDEIGFFDSIGYADYRNSTELAEKINHSEGISPPIRKVNNTNLQQPLYYLCAPYDNDGGIRILAELKKSTCPFRSYDSREVSRLSLHEAVKQVQSSVSVVSHLLDPKRTGALVHNARCAFVSGLAMAMGKKVLLLQEGGGCNNPIDYRDLVYPYFSIESIPKVIADITRATTQQIYYGGGEPPLYSKGFLDKIDIGDVAAENEIRSLISYFVRTPQFMQAKQGHAQIVIGRKGSGKTALFYGLRNEVSKTNDSLVLDLKPEGHQFVKFRELVLATLSEGKQLQVVSAFWHYLLVVETAKKIVEKESRTAWHDPTSLALFHEFEDKYNSLAINSEYDFSERLMQLINKFVDATVFDSKDPTNANHLTRMIYNEEIVKLSRLVVQKQSEIGNLWILFDNIDKGFTASGLCKEDVLIVRGLLEAARKVQRELRNKGIDCNSVVFIRRDVYDLLINETPDRGKEQAVNLDWSEPSLLEQLLLQRFRASDHTLPMDFNSTWYRIFDSHVGTEGSFRYILSRTLLRPRDLLNFTRKAIQIGASKNHARVNSDDIIEAERQYSEDMFSELRYELRDVFPEFDNILPNFIGSGSKYSKEDINLIALEAGIPEQSIDKILSVLVWFCFVGVLQGADTIFAYNLGYNQDRINKLLHSTDEGTPRFIVHPAFRSAIQITST